MCGAGSADSARDNGSVKTTETSPAIRWPIGHELELNVEAIAHGGHCVARHSGRVVFVRHTIPGERVLARITEDAGGSFARADATTVLDASPSRVTAPCQYARPGGCGGCDFQHVTPAAQRALKAQVITEQLVRVGKFSPEEVAALDIVVRELPGGPLGWRERTRFIASESGRLGLRKNRSHDVIEVEACAISAEGVNSAPELDQLWKSGTEVTISVAGPSRPTVITKPANKRAGVVASGPAHQIRHAAGRDWRVSADGFWQVHPAAAGALVETALSGIDLQPGETAFDLYAGCGLFTGALADLVGAKGTVIAVESDRSAVSDARHNVGSHPAVRVVAGRVEDVLSKRQPATCDAVVLDPPRSGAGRQVMRQIAALSPRTVAYVSCDPATLARDLAEMRTLGYGVDDFAAFDAFPMTHHVECVAVLRKTQ